ncbi:ESPR-type extended signal peptide-containing protein, partial [Psychrobacter sp.]|uniref:ESPR-type extended signal peptide-containing protein n=1 Tax=Psychrobacter sp. TaxID=56811 RepID=UPI003563E880
MNKVFKKIWSQSLGCIVVVSENAKSAGKTSGTTGTIAQIARSNDYKMLTLKGLAFSIAAISGSTVWAGVVCVTDPVSGGSTATGVIAVACGINNAADGLNSSALGIDNKASNEATSALGHANEATGNSSNAVGFFNKSSGSYSSAVGYTNAASGDYSSALGANNEA